MDPKTRQHGGPMLDTSLPYKTPIEKLKETVGIVGEYGHLPMTGQTGPASLSLPSVGG